MISKLAEMPNPFYTHYMVTIIVKRTAVKPPSAD